MNNTELIKSIEDRIKLILTISIFFPSLLAAFIKSDAGSKNVISWSILVGLSLLTFVFFQGVKNKNVSEKLLKYINRAFLFNLFFFTFPILYLATTDGSKTMASFTDKINFYTLTASLWGLPAVSLVLFIVVMLIALFHKKQ